MAVKVLIIEDDPEMNRLLQLDLERHGYESHVAVNGLDGLRMFHEIRPNLVVLDVALPMMDGLTVCQRIRELSNVPILIMTAHAVTEEEIAKGLNLGADEYMIKRSVTSSSTPESRRCCGAPSFRTRMERSPFSMPMTI
jgi:DNA-binding response OmpR family regulator